MESDVAQIKTTFMKKFISTLVMLVSVLSVSNGQFTAIGGGLDMSSGFRFHEQILAVNKSNFIGISFKGFYKVSEPFYISPSFTLFYPHITSDSASKQTISSMMFDIDGHYVINAPNSFEFYGLAGFNIMFAGFKYSSAGVPTYKESDNAMGLNIGIGTFIKITEKFSIYGEAKYIFNNRYNQIILNAGALLNIEEKKKPRNPE
jgi:Outer membrane protein beta-barrel domain